MTPLLRPANHRVVHLTSFNPPLFSALKRATSLAEHSRLLSIHRAGSDAPSIFIRFLVRRPLSRTQTVQDTHAYSIHAPLDVPWPPLPYLR